MLSGHDFSRVPLARSRRAALLCIPARPRSGGRHAQRQWQPRRHRSSQPATPPWRRSGPAARPARSAPPLTTSPSSTAIPQAGDGPHSAVIVLPGGGYTHEVMDKEGGAEARWLAAHGVSAYVLQYRLSPRYMYPAPNSQDGHARGALRPRPRRRVAPAPRRHRRLGLLRRRPHGRLSHHS
jgi:acetyl esterase/lipase